MNVLTLAKDAMEEMIAATKEMSFFAATKRKILILVMLKTVVRVFIIDAVLESAFLIQLGVMVKLIVKMVKMKECVEKVA